MRRRAFLSTTAVGATAVSAGCLGGDVVLARNKTVTVRPHHGDVIELPAEGEKLKYIARADRPFDVYVFKSTEAYMEYKAFVNDESPSKQPAGDRALGGRAIRTGSDTYEVATDDRGRQPLETDNTAYFVIDHSNYREETTIDEFADGLSVTLDLQVVKSTLPV